ncbi:MAG TPA: zinc ribbon domain-containing protein [Nitrososphaera sp.]|nr:zinc ribbon domain-containing protein [Nitrososphaera sp.]
MSSTHVVHRRNAQGAGWKKQKKEEKLDLSVRTFVCHSCGLVLDRDTNAAKNILKSGLEQTLAETEPLLIRQRISKFQSRKQEETHALRRV